MNPVLVAVWSVVGPLTLLFLLIFILEVARDLLTPFEGEDDLR